MKTHFWRHKRESELKEEINSHIEMAARDCIERGDSVEKAAASARRELGNDALIREVTRQMWGMTWFEQFKFDLLFAFRALRKTPAFTAAAILTLALAIGANTAIFSIIRAVIIRDLPFADPSRLVQLKNGQSGDWLIYRDFADLREQNRSFESMGASRFAVVTLTGNGMPEALYGSAVSYDMLSMLGAKPLLGRTFTADDDQPGHEHVVILSYSTWQNEFGREQRIVGRKIHLTNQDQEDFQVIGVMPPDFNFPLVIPSSVNPPTRQMAFWIPIGLDAKQLSRSGRTVMVTARLRPGVTINQAQSDVDRIYNDLARIYPQSNAGRSANIVAFSEFIFGNTWKAMLIIWGATAIVLLIACANIANLLLARALNRRRETGIRIALGANRWRLVRQWITESLLLALIGGCAGLLLAGLTLNVLLKIAPQDIPRLYETHIDITVLLLTIGLSLLAGLLFGLLPAWQAADCDPLEALKDGGGNAGTRRARTREILIISELALCVPLAIIAALLMQSFVKLLNVDTGFRPDGITAAIIVLPTNRYPNQDAQMVFFRKPLNQLQSDPAVESAATVDGVPLSGNISGAYVDIEEHPSTEQGDKRPTAEVFSITPNYLSIMGIPLVSGRMLSPEDAQSGFRSLLVNDTAAKEFWPGENPLGKRLYFDGIDKAGEWRQVVGVVKTTRDSALAETGRSAVYVPAEQGISFSDFLVVKAKNPSIDLTQDIRKAVADVDKDQPVFLVTSMKSLVDNSAAGERFSASMLSLFGLLATILAALGVYGLVSYTVASRMKEIGIRMALGAERVTILKMMLRWAMTRMAIGLTIGIIAAVGLTRLISSLLFEIRAGDLSTFIGVSIALISVSLIACYLPARRASKSDPMVVLRGE
ncbi:MAG TPA: ABC transporter permease [Blastocatellia bacterium]|nr:ABC transporter permease [Blastocatellia bacterium]